MAATPPDEVVAAVESGTAKITRRVELYEADGTTLWNPDIVNDPNFKRLVDGGVSVDSGRDERRTLDLTLLNNDHLLRPDSEGGLWYDKVVKVYRGCTYSTVQTPPSIALVEVEGTGNAAYKYRSFLAGLGFTKTDVLIGASTYNDVYKYDIILSFSGTVVTGKSQMLLDAYAAGKAVATISSANTQAELPFVTAMTAAGSALTWGLTPSATDSVLAGSFTTESEMIKTAPTNLAYNPYLETNANGWTSSAAWTSTRTVVASPYEGTYAYRSIMNATPTATQYAVMTDYGVTYQTRAAAGTVVGKKVRIRHSAVGVSRDVELRLRAYTEGTAGTVNGFASQVVTVTDTWQEVAIQGIMPSDGSTGFALLAFVVTPGGWTVGDYLDFDALISWVPEYDTYLPNYHTAPSAEGTVTTAQWGGNTVAQWTLVRTAVGDAAHGSYVMRSTNIATPTGGGVIVGVNVGASRTLAAQGEYVGERIKLRCNPGVSRQIVIRLYQYSGSALGSIITSSIVTLTDQWQEFVISGTMPAGGDGFGIRILATAPLTQWAVSDWMDADAALPWKNIDPLPGSFFSGDTPDNAAWVFRWSGAANNSASYRAPSWTALPVAGTRPTGLDATASTVSTWNPGSGVTGITGIVAQADNGGRWFDLHLPKAQGPQASNLLKAGLYWLQNFTPQGMYEIQLGEFCIDSISEDHFPYVVKITGRDYTKRCINSKLTQAVTFVAGTSLEELITALAANSGIIKMRLPSMPETLGSDVSYDRGTPRWEVMKTAADSFGYEIFFDNEGYLTMNYYSDPSYSPVTQIFKTGPEGNLVSYSRSTNDSRIYNHVCIYGDVSEGEEDRLPYFGEAINTEPSSPTRVARIGDRLYTFASSFFTSDEQAQMLAEQFLKIHALESYELNFGSIYYPWLEVGKIGEILDPYRLPNEPTRYLIDTMNFPLGLGPMDLTAKRVTFVSGTGV